MRVPSSPNAALARALWLAAVVAGAGLSVGGCYEHHVRDEPDARRDEADARSDEPDAPRDEPFLCGAPRIVGPESGRAGARCDDCGGRRHRAAPFVVRGDVAYRHARDLEVIDVSRPREPVLVGNVATISPRARSLALTDRALVVGGAMAEIYDLSNPLVPRYVASLPGTAVGFAVAARGSVAIVVSPEPGGISLRTFDLRNPSEPVQLGSLDLGGVAFVEHVALGDGVVWLVRTSSPDGVHELLAVDVRDPRAPVIASATRVALGPGGVEAISLAGDGLLVCGGDVTERYFDVSTSSPRLVAAHEGSPCGLLVTPSRSVVTLRDEDTWAWNVALFDVTRPLVPTELGRTTYAFEVVHAAIVGNALLLSNGEGLVAVPLSCE